MFEIKDKFYLNGEPFQIVLGVFHYFRMVPEYWRDRLEKLKNMGCNTVWEIGPQKRLYLPAPLLKKGSNTIIMFETEGKAADSILLAGEPKLEG